MVDQPGQLTRGATLNASAHYEQRVANTPPAGKGYGFHGYLMGTANVAVKAGIPLEQFLADMMAFDHRRPVRREIIETYRKAKGDHDAGTFVPEPRPEPVITDGRKALQKLIARNRGVTEADLSEASPISLGWPRDEDAVRVLSNLYEPDDLLFIGKQGDGGIVGKTIRSVREWTTSTSFKNFPHIIPNPLTGQPAPKKSGDGETFRGDNAVKVYRFCVVEFDDIPREEQLAFWAAVNLPVSALIDTGGKSIHGWLDVRQLAPVANLDEWDHQIKNRLYGEILIPLGVDPACSNAARLSRLPGHFRQEKQRFQRTIYLSPMGRKVF